MIEMSNDLLLAIGGTLAISNLVLILLSFVVQAGLAWTDDESYQGPNKYAYFITWVFHQGKSKKSNWTNTERLVYDRECLLVVSFFLSMPMVILPTAMYHFYPVFIGAGTLVLLAFVLRFVKRHKKLFEKHVTNTNAHK